MSFSTGLQSKIIRLWNAADITGLTSGQNVTAWTDQIASDTATPYAGFGSASGNSIYRPIAFGTQAGVECLAGVMGTSAAVTGVQAIFSLSKFDLAGAGDVGQGAFVVGGSASNSVIRGGGDVQLAIEARSNSNPSVLCYQDGINVGLALDRKSTPTAIGVILPANISIEVLGGNYFGSGRGTHGAFVLLNAVPTSGEIAEVTTYLHGLGSTSPPAFPTTADVFFGDSLTSEDSGSEPADGNSTYPGLVVRSRGGDRQWQNLGIFGDSASGCLGVAQGRGTTTITALRAAGVTDLTAYIHIGRNNIYASSPADPNSTADTVQSICTTLRTAGATRIILTTIGASVANDSATQATCDTNRATYNARLVAMAPTYADAVVRLDLDSDMGPNGSQTNNSFFTNDRIHWKSPAIERVATLITSQGFENDNSSSSSTHSSASSGSSQSNDNSSSSSSSSSHIDRLRQAGVLVGDEYLAIATSYATAQLKLYSAIDDFYFVVDLIARNDSPKITYDLNNPIYDAWQNLSSSLTATIYLESAVRAVQSHVLREYPAHNLVAYIQQEIIGRGLAAGIPEQWAILSKRVGFNIDSVIDPATAASSSSSS